MCFVYAKSCAASRSTVASPDNASAMVAVCLNLKVDVGFANLKKQVVSVEFGC